MNNIKLRIRCRTNPDLEGEWLKSDVLEEMRDLGITSHNDYDWIDYVLDHVFVETDCPQYVCDVLRNCETAMIAIKLDNDLVKIGLM